MAIYNYETGHVERDFKFRKNGEKCKLGGLPARVGNKFCVHCKYYCGSDFNRRADLENMFFTKCNHPEAKDSDNTREIISIWYDWFVSKAMAAFYY